MIGSLRGLLLERLGPDELLVEVGGVGYRVLVSPTTAVTSGEIGGEVFLHVHHYVREDAETLYGFRRADERRCFEALLGAHGVGPSLALAILSVHEPSALASILASEDVAALCLVPGVGKKTAARLLVELKARLDVPEFDDLESREDQRVPASARLDVRNALAELGYGPDEIREAIRDLPADGDAAALLKEALRRLAVTR